MNPWIDLFRRWYQSIIVCAAVIAFSSQPLMRFYSPVLLLEVGVTFTIVGVGFAFLRGHLEEMDRPTGRSHPRQVVVAAVLATLLGLLAATGFFVAASSTAVKDSRANDARCLAIQRDMLSAKPRRNDDPDMFQALACRPQGEGSVFAKPQTPIPLPQD
ncbi:hypothetical protein [Sphingomonas sp. PP-CE-1A-559]|uniref:hypothetical protein n=1 Tax=Sphingomonas sp. PP-CE-1A-559 TaxID=2135657 RepID=UPI0014047DE0|nr:hypothetical protein [Sphingomonas sp. PP-CE-1A-559]